MTDPEGTAGATGGRWTAGAVLAWAAADFRERGFDRPRLEAELLLAHVLRCPRLDLYTGHDRPLGAAELAAFREAVARRRGGEPAAYITGTRGFWSIDLAVGPDVLVPRPETELLVETFLARSTASRVLDLGCGSGCVGLALLHERAGLRVDAVDVSAAACAVARGNAERLGLLDRFTVLEGDLFAALGPEARYGAIVSNPPYVTDGEIGGLVPEVRREPRLALAGGADGLDVVRRILRAAPRWLEPGGLLLLELDPRQTGEVATELGPALFGSAGEILCDLAGFERVVVFRRG
jgi:release factor glutamine methyltransferase